MNLAIMQPYLFPYIGYFQLLRAADVFVVYDDVNFIKGGWINRNFILSPNDKQPISLRLDRASPNKLINEIELGIQSKKLLETLRQRYGKAPHFSSVFPVLEDVLTQAEKNLARFLDYQLRQICHYLSIDVEWRISSALEKNSDLRGQEKVLAICHELGASRYINLSGGRALYQDFAFNEMGIELAFLQTKPISYRQYRDEFVPNLSIIDVLMFNDKDQCAELLGAYELA